MSSSDDEAEAGPQSVSNYHFVDDDDAPTSFSDLPLYRSQSENKKDDDVKLVQIFVHGSVDNGLQTIHKEVIAWKYDLLNAKPEMSVLTKENNWIKLQKPRKSFEEIIRTVLITVQCLHFARRNPEASEKSVWDHLCKVFSLYEVKPSQNDLVDHMDLISEAVKRNKSLAKSKFLLAFLNKKPRKRKLSNEDVKPTSMSGFIVDDVDDVGDGMLEEGEDGEKEEDIFDSVCAFCDDGGDILCCDGSCMRSFHPTVEDGVNSACVSLGFSKTEVEAIKSFYCKNCQYKQHQCFACGELGSSDKSSPEVFQCASATCGYFYHPHCVAKLLCQNNEVAAMELEKTIAEDHGFFTCPIHKCCVCKQGEDKQIKELQFAVCRRCPTSYHRKCLPKEISIEMKVEREGEAKAEEVEVEVEEEDGVETRAWEGLLPGRLLLYCLKHEIDDELSTPIRDIRFPGVVKKREERRPDLPKSSGKVISNREKLKVSSSERTIVKEEWEPPAKKVANLKRRENISSGLNSLRKVKENDTSRKPMKRMTSDATEVNKFGKDQVRKTSLGDRLFALMSESSEGKLGEQYMLPSEVDNTTTPKASTKKLSGELPSVDADAERSILALMKEVESSITLEDVIRKRKAPSTHSSSLKQVVEKNITAGRVEGAIQAIRRALEKLDAGWSPEDAKAICEPEVLHQIFKWKNKLSVYLAPFLRGKRYTSFGRHFTKVEKLNKIVDMLHWYIKDGDMIVDFCCGANDFSCLMKKKLEETGKTCLYKNYDLIQPKIDFNFEKRDWMTVKPQELPKRGSQLIMGLNPPFGVKAALANKFINQALKFKPKLLILIVPPETERLDRKNPPYDLVWEDNQCLSGKSFYLPGSVDENDKQMDQWNLTTPPLYLWSRRDWTGRHIGIAQKHGHLSVRKENPENCLYDGNASEMTDHLNMQNTEPSHKESVAEGHRECSSRGNVVRENHDSDAPERKQPKETLGKREHGEYELGGSINEKLPENIQDGRESPRSDSSKGIPPRSSPKVFDDRCSKEVTTSKSPEMPVHANAVENRKPNSEHEKSSLQKSPGNSVENELLNPEHRNSDMSLGSDLSKGMPHHSSTKVVHGRSSRESTATKSPEMQKHAEAVGNRLPNSNRRKSNSQKSNSRKSRGRNSYGGMPHRSSPKVVQGKSSWRGTASKSPEFPNKKHRKSSSGMPSRRAYGDSGHDDTSRHHSTNYYENSRDFHGSSHANMDYHSGGPARETTESVGLRAYPTELGMDLDALSQVPRYDSAQRNYIGGGHEPAYGQMGTHPSIPSVHFGYVSESYRMNIPAMQPATDSYRMNTPGMQPAPEPYRTNMSATQRYAPRLDELNHTRMSNMGPDPSMYNPLQPQSGYNADSIGFATGPRRPFSHQSSTGWLDE